jgi:UDP-N-acetylglucosamine--N-acetylmuramyl-(pentapeptide) pyrophosphoryl-undecaprenol N-acetylglucosamine transferase
MSLSKSSRSSSKILIAAGGTGGHLFPAQALAQELLQKKEGAEVLFAGTGLETNRYFLKEQFPYEEVASATVFRSKRHLFHALVLLCKGVIESFRILNRFQPQLVVGFGSFHAFPLLAAALLKRVPFVLFESNFEPGKVNRLFSRWAILSAVQFSGAKDRLSGPIVEVKMPIWQKNQPKDHTIEEARSYFGLSSDAMTLLVFGGSQGSSAINHIFCQTAAELHRKGKSFQVIHLTGKVESGEQMRHFYDKLGIRALVKEFEDQMHLAWRAASVVICRSGAATLAEQIAFEVPGILIPYPFAADQHQKKNALFMEKHIQGGICLLEEECSVENLLKKIEILLDEKNARLEMMRANIRHFKEAQDKKDLYSIICNLLD